MTVCIASFCEQTKSIFAISDHMISTGDMSVDFGAIKFRRINPHWMAMFAGNDVSTVVPVLRRVRRLLPDREVFLEAVGTAFQVAIQEQITSRVETSILAPYGMNTPQFVQDGLRNLGQELFARLAYQMAEVSLDIMFLVFGFEEGQPHIFTVDGRGAVANHDISGFWAIGSGCTNALGTLFSLRLPLVFLPEGGVLYTLAKAKFNAESAFGVGRRTVGLKMQSGGSGYSIAHEEIETLREVWEAERPFDYTQEANTAATAIIEVARKREAPPEVDDAPSVQPPQLN
jgi:ATP-dependent protease HslVU (ClpYQ) peptidase subunit